MPSEPSAFLPLAPARFHILVALSAGESHGYAVMQAVERSSEGLVKMGPATLYGTLKKLVALGLAEEVDRFPARDDDQRRRYYRLTALGERVCLAEGDRLAHLVRQTRRHLRPETACA